MLVQPIVDPESASRSQVSLLHRGTPANLFCCAALVLNGGSVVVKVACREASQPDCEPPENRGRPAKEAAARNSMQSNASQS
jgi:hypothetical protein